MALFDAYLMVCAVPPAGGNRPVQVSLWERRGGGLAQQDGAELPGTDAATAWLADRLSDLVARGLPTLLGVDGMLGFPAMPFGSGDGCADRSGRWLLALRDHPWLEGRMRLWPLETGRGHLERPAAGGILAAGIAPKWLGAVSAADTARLFASLDGAGRLGLMFQASGEVLDLQAAATADGDRSPLTDPTEIYRKSFAIIRDETDLARFPADLRDLVVRIVHACGMPDIAHDLSYTPNAGAAGRAALASGRAILADAQMVAHGIIRRRLPAANPVICSLDDSRAAELAASRHTTRSAAAVRLWADQLDGAVVAIGNAPTALFELLRMIAEGVPKPALILGFPVGFVGAAESKEALVASGLDHVCLRGRRGGSAMAAAAVNALAGRPEDA